MPKVWIHLALLFFLCQNAKAQNAIDTLYINNGLIAFDTSGFFSYPFLAFNNKAQFSSRNSFLELNSGQNVQLTFFNNDSFDHTIQISTSPQITVAILSGASQTINLNGLSDGIYNISDAEQKFRFMGLGTYLKVWPQTAHEFHWSLNEIESELNSKITNGISFDPDSFLADYFTINDKVHPFIESDSLSKVRGNVGDSIYIFVHNAGEMVHAIHFHGYHVEILYSGIRTELVGRIKDSIPILPKEGQVYLLIPNQPGIYPVHDHNLVATSGGGNYPNGMMVLLDIEP
jgi:hypothetical protein